jgi:predicted 2-oxoglutarate/Fe(II)-dependent dioxygenase YbiX
MLTLEECIVVVENVLSKDVCASIINEYGKTDEWKPLLLLGDLLDKETRSATGIAISNQNTIGINQEVRKKIDHDLFVASGEAYTKFSSKFFVQRQISDSGYDLLRYEVGQFYKEHIDDDSAINRTVSCSFALNDDYEGGEWAFFGGQYKLRVPAGSAIMFPSNFLFPHQILPVSSGVRYSVVTWFF